MNVIGIDVGINGGWANIAHDDTLHSCGKLETRSIKGVKEIDGDWLTWKLAEQQDEYPDLAVCFEECGFHMPSSRAMRSVAMSAGIIVGVCDAMLIDYLRVQPRKWQKQVLGKVQQGGTKEAAKSRAMELWPKEEFRATKRSGKFHDGIIDAALIGYWALNR